MCVLCCVCVLLCWCFDLESRNPRCIGIRVFVLVVLEMCRSVGCDVRVVGL